MIMIITTPPPPLAFDHESRTNIKWPQLDQHNLRDVSVSVKCAQQHCHWLKRQCVQWTLPLLTYLLLLRITVRPATHRNRDDDNRDKKWIGSHQAAMSYRPIHLQKNWHCDNIADFVWSLRSRALSLYFMTALIINPTSRKMNFLVDGQFIIVNRPDDNSATAITAKTCQQIASYHQGNRDEMSLRI